MLGFSLNRRCVFNDVEYEIIQVLDNELVLVVKAEDLLNKSYPIQTYILPDNLSTKK